MICPRLAARDLGVTDTRGAWIGGDRGGRGELGLRGGNRRLDKKEVKRPLIPRSPQEMSNRIC